jgi:hypothetical protein
LNRQDVSGKIAAKKQRGRVMSGENNGGNNFKFLLTQIRKNFRMYIKKLSILGGTGLVTFFVSWLIVYYLLLMPGKLYAAYRADDNIVRDIQLMLTLKGIKTKSPLKIDGELGPITEEAITIYQIENKMEPTGKANETLRYKLFQDIKTAVLPSNPSNETEEEKGVDVPNSGGEETIGALYKKLETTRDDMKNTNAALKALSDNMASYFINNFRDLVALLATAIGITVALFGVWLGFYLPIFKKNMINTINQTHEKKMEETESAHIRIRDESKSKVQYTIYINLSSAFYKYYKNFLKNQNEDHSKISPELEGGIYLAIWFVDKAIRSIVDLPQENREKSDMMEQAKSHKAYHYASQSLIGKLSDEHKNEALYEADRIKKLAVGFWERGEVRKWMVTMDTTAWIYILLGDTEKKEEGMTLLKQLSKYPEFLEECGGNYRKIGVTV